MKPEEAFPDALVKLTLANRGSDLLRSSRFDRPLYGQGRAFLPTAAKCPTRNICTTNAATRRDDAMSGAANLNLRRSLGNPLK